MNPITSEPDILERCGELLGLSLPQLNLYFKAYLQRTMASIDFSDYVIMATARSHRSFLFDNGKSAFDMLKEPGVPVILLDRFVQYGPLFFPLVSRQYPERIFEILCSAPVPNDVLFEKHITWSSFQTYVEALKAEFDEQKKLEAYQSLIETISPDFRFQASSQPDHETLILQERIVFVSSAATLKQTLGSATGTFIVTNSTIAFQTSVQLQILRRTIVYPVNSLVQLSPSQRGVFKTGYTLILEFDVAGTQSESDGDSSNNSIGTSERRSESPPDTRPNSRKGSTGNAASVPRSTMEISFQTESERDYCFEYLQSVSSAMELCRRTPIPIVRQCILHDAIDDILRAQALRKTRFPCQNRRITFFSTMSPEECDKYSQLLTNQFHDMTLSCSLLSSLFTRAPSRILDDPMWDPRMLELVDNPLANAPVKDKLDLGQLSDAAKTFAALIAPLDFIAQVHSYLHSWQSPSATIAFVTALLFMAFMNWLVFIPAVIFLANYFLLWILADRPDIISDFYSCFSDNPQIEPSQQNRALFIEKIFGASLISKIKNKVDDYHQSFSSAKSALETVQNKLKEANHYCMKLKGLYTWVSPLRSRQFMSLNALIFAMLAILPFRVIFSLIVIIHFTEHFRSDSGMIQQFISTIPLSDSPRIKKSQ